MNLKDLISKVAIETSVPASDVRKITNAVLDTIIANIQAGEDFVSPKMKLRSVTIDSSEKDDGEGGKKIIPATKIGRITIKDTATEE